MSIVMVYKTRAARPVGRSSREDHWTGVAIRGDASDPPIIPVHVFRKQSPRALTPSMVWPSRSGRRRRWGRFDRRLVSRIGCFARANRTTNDDRPTPYVPSFNTFAVVRDRYGGGREELQSEGGCVASGLGNRFVMKKRNGFVDEKRPSRSGARARFWQRPEMRELSKDNRERKRLNRLAARPRSFAPRLVKAS